MLLAISTLSSESHFLFKVILVSWNIFWSFGSVIFGINWWWAKAFCSTFLLFIMENASSFRLLIIHNVLFLSFSSSCNIWYVYNIKSSYWRCMLKDPLLLISSTVIGVVFFKVSSEIEGSSGNVTLFISLQSKSKQLSSSFLPCFEFSILNIKKNISYCMIQFIKIYLLLPTVYYYLDYFV